MQHPNRATRPRHQPQILLRAQPADREDDDVGGGRGALRGAQGWVAVWGKIRSGNMRDKKRDVDMKYEGRGKGGRGRTWENTGKNEKSGEEVKARGSYRTKRK
ncbi:hypothetical protein B0H13DRAFT_1861472 [Mycena leptocephala]|nr:hypothetical protein B0H13DRAFT_1861472 [Mycena leptocephala]